MISIRQVTHVEGSKTILDSVSIELDARRIAIIGANGSGKSTFARLLNGLVLPTEGSVSVDDIDTREQGAALRRLVGFVFQNPDIQFVFPTVEEDLAFGLKNMGFDKAQREERVAGILTRFNLESLRHESVHTLSGGEKQLLCIAAVLVMEPTVIVFDEPTTLLDLANTRLVNHTIAALSQQTVVVTHDLEFAAGCECVALLDQGRLVCSGPPDAVINDYLARVNNA